MRRRVSSVADHPRSRGVYTDTKVRAIVGDGSSPLARGLPSDYLDEQWARGIIPARAGFTGTAAIWDSPTGDHPRSRGVYCFSCLIDDMGMGSSPLARGLRDNYPNARIIVGIIPARAGFTPRSGRPSHARSDHPRSRGVYSAPLSESLCRCGSSPLARGLRMVLDTEDLDDRIIPARAGFTPADGLWIGHVTDHPRSRGVYSLCTDGIAIPRGSSPLARGLPCPRRGWAPLWGIIPARAGFTWARARTPPSPSDHPRSRGVYMVP